MIEKLHKNIIFNLSRYFSFYLFSIILLVISPIGNLSGNEEMYYGLAKKFTDSNWNGVFSSFIASGDYRIISDSLIGYMVSFFGFEGTQIIGSILASFLFAHAITKLFNLLDISNVHGLLSIIIFILIGQSLIGREWLFEDFEAKIFSYYFVLLGIKSYLQEKNYQIALYLSLATYFHLLVGFSWFALLLASSVIHNRHYVIAVKSFMLYVLLSSPILIIAAYGFLGGEFIQDPNLPSPSYIYSYIRQYKMVLPFYSVSTFVVDWLPGILVHIGLLVGIIFLNTEEDHNLNKLLSLLVVSTIIIFVLLLISLFDNEGVLAKFYPYRYTSLLLLLFITFYTSNLKLAMKDLKANLSLVGVIILLPLLLITAAIKSAFEFQEIYLDDNSKDKLYEFISSNTNAGEIVLIQPEIEEIFFDFERKVNRPTLVTFKYIPSSKVGLTEWFKRREFKAQVFNRETNPVSYYPYSYILVNVQSKSKYIDQEIIYENSKYTLFTNLR
tara:strand:+ start:22224 stop:23717 length:1494 start_codon:yes stop_codon:yes gene_type:complete